MDNEDTKLRDEQFAAAVRRAQKSANKLISRTTTDGDPSEAQPDFVMTIRVPADGTMVSIDHPMGEGAWVKARRAMQVAVIELNRQLTGQDKCPARPRSLAA